jgi:hypothetical protein
MAHTPGNSDGLPNRTTDGESPHKAGAFDIRVFIASLIGIYGIVLVITGIVQHSATALRKTGGWNINLYAGIGMIIFAGIFLIWARTRPVVVRVRPEDLEDSGRPPAH